MTQIIEIKSGTIIAIFDSWFKAMCYLSDEGFDQSKYLIYRMNMFP